MNDDENDNPKRYYGKSALHDFLQNLSNQDLPKGWRETELGKRAYEIGHQEGYMKGIENTWKEANKVIDSIRNIISLHDGVLENDYE